MKLASFIKRSTLMSWRVVTPQLMGGAVRQRLRDSRRLVGPLLLLVAVPSCQSPVDPAITDPDAFFIDGRIEFLNLEGGCWSLRTTEGQRYEPRPLTEDYRVDGLKVRAAIKFDPVGGGICQFGPVVRVLWIRRR